MIAKIYGFYDHATPTTDQRTAQLSTAVKTVDKFRAKYLGRLKVRLCALESGSCVEEEKEGEEVGRGRVSTLVGSSRAKSVILLPPLWFCVAGDPSSKGWLGYSMI